MGINTYNDYREFWKKGDGPKPAWLRFLESAERKERRSKKVRRQIELTGLLDINGNSPHLTREETALLSDRMEAARLMQEFYKEQREWKQERKLALQKTSGDPESPDSSDSD